MGARVSKLVVIREGKPRDAALQRCESCGSEHLAPVPCGLTFKERIRTARMGTDWMPSRTDARQRDPDKHRYFDSVALDEAFGPDRREKMLHETRGLGPVRTAADGSQWVYDDPRTGEMRPMESSDIVGGYLRGSDNEGD